MRIALFRGAILIAILGGTFGAGTGLSAAQADPGAGAPWSGCYAGLHVSGGTIADSWTSGPTGDQDGAGVAAGGQVGYSRQLGHLVVGLEWEVYWSGLENKATWVAIDGADAEHWSTRNKYAYDLAFRFGLTAEQALLYGKLGWVRGSHDFHYDQLATRIENSASAVKMDGVLFGLGAEYAVAPRWTLKFEFDDLKFRSTKFTLDRVVAGVPHTYTDTHGASDLLARVGVNRRF